MRKKRVGTPDAESWRLVRANGGGAYTGLGAARLNGVGLLGGTGIARYSGAQLLDCGEVAEFSAKRVVPQGCYALSLS